MLIEQEVTVAGGECLKVFLLDVAHQMNVQDIPTTERETTVSVQRPRTRTTINTVAFT